MTVTISTSEHLADARAATLSLYALLICLQIWMFAGPAAAACGTASCSSSACTITDVHTPGADCDLDLSGKDVEISGSIQVPSGTKIVLKNAKSLKFTGSGSLLAPKGAIHITDAGKVEMLSESRFDALTIDISSSGKVSLSDTSALNVSSASSKGGLIKIKSGSFEMGHDSTSKKPKLLANGVQNDPAVPNGTIEITTTSGDLIVRRTGVLEARATEDGSRGGDVDLVSQAGKVQLDGTVDVSGIGDSTHGGNGGTVEITSPGNIELTSKNPAVDANIIASGDGSSALGGKVYLQAPGTVKVNGAVDARGKSASGTPIGGHIRIGAKDSEPLNSSPCTVEIRGSLKVDGKTNGTILVRYRQSLDDGVEPNTIALFVPTAAASIECGCVRTALGNACDSTLNCAVPPKDTTATAGTLQPTAALLPCEGCLNGTKEGSEECDQSDLSVEDFCLPNCTLNQCGDTHVNKGVEDCDDGNDETDDCCLPSCKFEIKDANCKIEKASCMIGKCDGKGKCEAKVDVGQSCSDPSACTKDKTCQVGKKGEPICTGPPVVCDDGNVCTSDKCEEPTGCIHDWKSQENKACDDGNVCSNGTKCLGAVCKCPKGENCAVSGSDGKACDDGNICSKGTKCNKGKCACPTGKWSDCADRLQTNNSCVDNSGCTTNETCKKGKCIGTFVIGASCRTPTGQFGACMRPPQGCHPFNLNALKEPVFQKKLFP